MVANFFRFIDFALVLFVLHKSFIRLLCSIGVTSLGSKLTYTFSEIFYFENNSYVLLSIFLYLGCRSVKKINFQNSIVLSWKYALVIFLFLLPYLISSQNLEINFATFYSFLPYFSSFFLPFLLAPLLRFFSKKEEPTVKDSSETQDVPTVKKEDFNEAQKHLAKKIVASIRKDLEKNTHNATSYGIEAKWGKGKSSFLNLIRQDPDLVSDKDLIYCEYKVWLQDRKSEIRDEFFKFFANRVLKDISINLENKILDYSLSLKQIDNKFINFIISLMNRKPDQDRYDEIHEELKKSKKKYLIVIDDIDRLMEKADILEVYRLVRSISNFSNIAFLLLYDRRHISKILESSKHIDKIVNCEFNYPEYSKEKLQASFNELYEKIVINEFEDLYLFPYYSDNFDPIFKILETIRDQKRFLKNLKLKYHTVFANKTFDPKTKIVIAWTVFLLTLVEYYSLDIYEKIKSKDPNLIIDQGNFCNFNVLKIDKIENGVIVQKALPDYISESIIEIFKLLNNSGSIFNDGLGKSSHDVFAIYNPKYFRFFFEFGLNDEMLSSGEISKCLKVIKDVSGDSDRYFNKLYELGLKFQSNSDPQILTNELQACIREGLELEDAKVFLDLFFYNLHQKRNNNRRLENLYNFYESATNQILRAFQEKSLLEFKSLKNHMLSNYVSQDSIFEQLYFLLFIVLETGYGKDDVIKGSLFEEEIKSLLIQLRKTFREIRLNPNSDQVTRFFDQYFEPTVNENIGYIFSLIDSLRKTDKAYKSRILNILVLGSLRDEGSLKRFLQSFFNYDEKNNKLSFTMTQDPYIYPPSFDNPRLFILMGWKNDIRFSNKGSLAQFINYKNQFLQHYDKWLAPVKCTDIVAERPTLIEMDMAINYLNEFSTLVDKLLNKKVPDAEINEDQLIFTFESVDFNNSNYSNLYA